MEAVGGEGSETSDDGEEGGTKIDDRYPCQPHP